MPHAPAPTSPSRDTLPPGWSRRWTHSAAEAYRACPLQLTHLDARSPREPATREQRLGRVLHDAVGAAFRAAQTEARTDRYPVVGEHVMFRYWDAARRALGAAWEAERCAPVRADANRVVAALERLLRELPLPGRGEVVLVEQAVRATLYSMPVLIKPDLVLRPVNRAGRPGATMRIVDWKLGHVRSRGEVTRSDQMLRYAAVLAPLHPDVEVIIVEMRSLLYPNEAISGFVAPERAAAAAMAWRRIAVRAEADHARVANAGEHCMSCPVRGFCSEAWPPAKLGATVAPSGAGR